MLWRGRGYGKGGRWLVRWTGEVVQRREICKRRRVKARVVKRGRAAEAKVVNVMQLFRRHVWTVVEGGVGVVVEHKVQIGMRDVSVLWSVRIRGEGVGEGAAFGKGAIIHRGVVNG